MVPHPPVGISLDDLGVVVESDDGGADAHFLGELTKRCFLERLARLDQTTRKGEQRIGGRFGA